MALTPRLDLRQAQTLVMTPQLQQAIKLLQFSSLELTAFVDQQLEENPFLERSDADPDAPAGEPAVAVVESGEPRSLDTVVSDDPATISDGDMDIEIYDNVFDTGDSSFDDRFTDAPIGGGRQERGGSFDDPDINLEAIVAERITLRDHLLGQVAVDLEDPVDRLIALQLIDLLDDAGYLTGDIATVAELLGCPVARVEETLTLVQRMDPPGVFARSLAECLTLQLHDRGPIDPAMAVVLANLDMVARRDWVALARLAEVRTDRLSALISELRTLNPKPALTFDHGVAAPVIPDILMRARPSGDWFVELNPEALPRVLVNNHYYSQITRSTRTRQDRQYINECMQSANWLVKSLHQRATTILKVSTEIIRQQDGFFIIGVQGLKPLVLRDIADAIGMHESTVSRVTSNKYMATPRGIFELKYFFTHGIGGTNGGEIHSAESVRYRIKLLIDTEVTNTVLSDDALAEMLQKEGIDIARRTVAKYREAMGIPSSVMRRRLKSAEL